MHSSYATMDHKEDIWDDIKSFFNAQNSLIILAVICVMFFFITLCLVFIIIQLLKKKRRYKKQTKSMKTNVPNNSPKLDPHHMYPSFPIQMGLTSNQIASLGTIASTNQELSATTIVPSSINESNKTQSFDAFDNESKPKSYEKVLTPTNPTIDNDDIETVNEVLAMEERNGKVYYKVNFTGHPSDYTAWVCEEDLIPE